MDIIISFVIPCLNQSEHVREWLQHFIQYPGNDVEVIISDDGSTDNLDEVVESFHDKRVSVVRNVFGHGQDLNILNGINNACGQFIWLFRTKDFVIADRIGEVIKVLKSRDDIAYLTGSALDENGATMLSFKNDEIINAGMDAVVANGRIYEHPSGCIYRREWIDVVALKEFLVSKTDALRFIYLYWLIRLSLTQKGCFILMKDYIWIYTHTVKASSKSANILGKSRQYIFDPELNYMRITAQFEWTAREVCGEQRDYTFVRLFGWYLMQNTWTYYLNTKDKDVVAHYGIDFRNVDMNAERKNYLEVVSRLEDEYGLKDSMLFQNKKSEYLKKNIEYCNSLLQ